MKFDVKLNITALKFQTLPSTIGKDDKNDNKAGGVAFKISSNTSVAPEPTNPTMALDDELEAVLNPGVVLVEIPTSTVKQGY